MKIEKVDGSTAYSGLFTEGIYTWNFIIREGGSVSIYATRPGVMGHLVVFDTLDGEVPGEAAMAFVSKLAQLAEGISLLVAATQPKGIE